MNVIKKQIKELFQKGFFHILLGGTLTKIIAFFSSIVIVRFVSKEDYAYLSYADNIYSYIYLITGIGMDCAVLRYCVNDEKRDNAYLKFAFKYGTLFEIIVMAIFLTVLNIFPPVFEQSKVYMIALMVYPFLYYWMCLGQSYIRAKLMNREYALTGIFQALLVLLISFFFVFTIGTFSVIIARYVANLLVLIFILKCIKPYMKSDSYNLSRGEKKLFIEFGLSMLVANVFSMVMPLNESFLINNLIRSEIVTANYRVANMFPQQLTFLTSAMVTFSFPYFAKMSKKKEIKKLSLKIGFINFGIVFVVALIGIVVSPLIISLIYGDKYNDITLLMSMLWIMHALNAGLRMLPMNILPAIGYTGFNVKMSILACLFHFIIDYFCIKFWGISGAVIAGCIVYSITAISYWLYLMKKIREM